VTRVDRSLGEGSEVKAGRPAGPPSLPVVPSIIAIGSRLVMQLLGLLIGAAVLGALLDKAFGLPDPPAELALLLPVVLAALLVREVRQLRRARAAFFARCEAAVDTSQGFTVVPGAADRLDRPALALETDPSRQVEAVYAFVRELWTPPAGWRREELTLGKVVLLDGPQGPTDRVELLHGPSGTRAEVFVAFPFLAMDLGGVMLHMGLHAAKPA
jgi:hypothetical protein